MIHYHTHDGDDDHDDDSDDDDDENLVVSHVGWMSCVAFNSFAQI